MLEQKQYSDRVQNKLDGGLNVICLTDEALLHLVRTVVRTLRKEQGTEPKDRWIASEEALECLHISSRTTLQKLRDSGAIRFTRVSAKLILYDRLSIQEYLDEKAQNRF